MNSSKRENLLNLALDATEEERLQSLNLNVGYQEETDTWEVIVKYTGSLRKLEEIFPDIEVTELSNEYAVIRLPEALMDAVTDRTEIEYMEKLRFIADTDWQSNVDRRPSISLQIAFTIYFINLFPFY